jgi:hypothetical protein
MKEGTLLGQRSELKTTGAILAKNTLKRDMA